MVDFCKCLNKDCPHSAKCYRFVAVPDVMQWYFLPSPDGESCAEFMPIPLKLTNAQIIENYIKSYEAAPLMHDPAMITKTSTKGEDDGRTKKSKKGR